MIDLIKHLRILNKITEPNAQGMSWVQSICLVLFILVVPQQLVAQSNGVNDSIEKHRKGLMIIRAKPGAVIKVEQISHHFMFGSAISNGFVNGKMSTEDRLKYEELFLKNFNGAVTENALKWPDMESEKGVVNYQTVDAILAWTTKHNLPLRGHNLFWGIEKFIQPWVKELNNEELTETIQARAKDIGNRYKGRFVEYDLNNEMIHGNYYSERLGDGITKEMTDWVLEADSSAIFFLNDYDILTGKKLSEYMTQIRSFLEMGVPIGGIGVQGHSHGETFDRDKLREVLDSLAVFKLPIRVTEFNMPGQNSKYYSDRSISLSEEEEKQKAMELVDFYTICFGHPAVDGILMWGFWEGANWIPSSAIYKRDWTPTPAAIAYQDLLFEKWWTKAKGHSNVNGVFTTPAFFGKYRITTDSKTIEVDFNPNSMSEPIEMIH